MRRKKNLLISILAITLFISFASLSWADEQTLVGKLDPKLPRLEVTFLDVGQGDAYFIRTPSGRTILIDGGPKEEPSYLLSYLKKKGVRQTFWQWLFAWPKIDTIVLTHPYLDHLGGLPPLLEEFKVEEVIDPGIDSKLMTYKNFLKALKEKGCHYQVVERGQVLEWDPSLKVEVLSPPKEHFQDTSSDINNNSVVIKLTYGEVSFLFTGDIQSEAEKELVRLYGQELKSTILKVPHHGDSSSSTLEFIQAVSPEWAIVSCGKHNEYGYPSNEVIEKYEKIGTKVYRTDTYNTVRLIEGFIRRSHNGTITFLTEGKHYEIRTEKHLKRLALELQEKERPPQIAERPERIKIETLNNEGYFLRVDKALKKARKSIFIAMYIISLGKGMDNPANMLAQDLIDAKKRGVEVKVILDRTKSGKTFSDIQNREAFILLTAAGVEVNFDSPERKTHDKFLVVDEKITIVGNHNWTKNALAGSQNESSVLIKSKSIAQEFLKYFNENEW